MFGKTQTNLAAAGVAMIAVATSAQAAVVVVEVNEIFETVAGLQAAVALTYDLDGDGTNDIMLAYDKAFSVDTLFPLDTKTGPSGLRGLTGLLNAGDGVPTSGSLSTQTRLVYFDGGFASSLVTSGGLAPLPNSGYVGIRFPGGGGLLEGWLEFAATGKTLDDTQLTFVRYGYEDAGGAITMGETAAVPAPAAGLLMVGGVAALGAMGRRRKTRS